MRARLETNQIIRVLYSRFNLDLNSLALHIKYPPVIWRISLEGCIERSQECSLFWLLTSNSKVSAANIVSSILVCSLQAVYIISRKNPGSRRCLDIIVVTLPPRWDERDFLKLCFDFKKNVTIRLKRWDESIKTLFSVAKSLLFDRLPFWWACSSVGVASTDTIDVCNLYNGRSFVIGFV